MRSVKIPCGLLGSAMLAAMVTAAAAQYPQSQPAPPAQAAAQPSKAAAGVNQKAADWLSSLNKSEIETAQMMQQHSQNTQVQDYAKMVISDHQATEDKLEAVAGQTNLSLQGNGKMEKSAARMDQKLQAETPAQADKSYLAAEVQEHSHAIAHLQKLQDQVSDAQLKSLMQSTLPDLQRHLDAAQKLQAQLGK